jgi:ribonuclease-3
MTRLRSKLVRTTMLSQFSRFLELYNYVLITDHCEKENFRSNPKILEDIFEAFIGAISLDIGYKAAETLVINIIQKRVNFTELIYTDDNYKDKLMRYYQKYYDGYTPKYVVIKTEGELPDVIYTMGVLDQDGNIVGEGTDTSKKQASQIAAKEALKKYNEN